MPGKCYRVAYQRDLAAMVAAACTHIGLPRPREVLVTHASVHPGVPLVSAFPRLRRKDGSERRHAHAILVFERPVCGPVLIGARSFGGMPGVGCVGGVQVFTACYRQPPFKATR